MVLLIHSSSNRVALFLGTSAICSLKSKTCSASNPVLAMSSARTRRANNFAGVDFYVDNYGFVPELSTGLSEALSEVCWRFVSGELLFDDVGAPLAAGFFFR